MGVYRPGGVIHTDIMIHLKADAERAQLRGASKQSLHASFWSFKTIADFRKDNGVMWALLTRGQDYRRPLTAED